MWVMTWMIYLGCCGGIDFNHENIKMMNEISRIRLDWPFPLPRPDDEEEMPARKQRKSVSS